MQADALPTSHTSVANGTSLLRSTTLTPTTAARTAGSSEHAMPGHGPPAQRTSLTMLLSLVGLRWTIEVQGPRPRGAQLREDTQLCSPRNGAPLLAPLRTLALNVLRSNGIRVIRPGLMAVAHDISEWTFSEP
jgi:hypothetical protein